MPDDAVAIAAEDAGRQVADTLERIQSRYGFTMLSDVLLLDASRGPQAVRLDHVIVDRSGLLVIEAFACRDAQLRGTRTDAEWTAIYPNGRSVGFPNPLQQNERHLALLHQLLKNAGSWLSLDSVRGFTVLVDADVSHLEPGPANSSRVITLEELAATYEQRDEFLLGPPMTADEQSALAAAVSSLNRSSGASPVDAAHSRQDTPPAPDTSTTGADPAARSATLPAYPPLSGSAPMAASPPNHAATRNLIVAASITAVVLLAAVAFVGFRLSQWTPAAPESPRTPSAAPSAMPSDTPAPPPAPDDEIRSYDKAPEGLSLESAKAAFKRKNPAAYAQVADPDNPTVSPRDAGIYFTWEYVDRASSSAVEIRRFTVILDDEGTVLGFDQERPDDQP